MKNNAIVKFSRVRGADTSYVLAVSSLRGACAPGVISLPIGILCHQNYFATKVYKEEEEQLTRSVI